MGENVKRNGCVHQRCVGGYYYCGLVEARQRAMNEANDDVKYGGVTVHLDDRCLRKRGCGYVGGKNTTKRTNVKTMKTEKNNKAKTVKTNARGGVGRNPPSWNVSVWDINTGTLEAYDVVPTLMEEWKRLKRSSRPKTQEEFGRFLEREASYHFRSKCEYETVVCSWPKGFGKEVKTDAYEQLRMNWDLFTETLWTWIRRRSR